VPGGLRQGSVIAHHLEKAEEGVQNEEDVVYKLETLHRRVVLWEDQAIGGFR
jgi:hypothetical protein